MVSIFEDQLIKLPTKPVGKQLPLTHVTDWATFLSIEQAGRFCPPSPCSLYNEPLVYTFYGRPAYRLKDTCSSHHLLTYSPVCFVLRPELVNAAKRVMPFDSGGFDIYGPAMHPSFTKDMFELTTKADSALRVVNGFWGSNKNYSRQAAKTALTIKVTAAHLLHYHSLITNKLSEKFDDRCSTVEVQLPSPLPLTGNVLALVAPGVSDSFAETVAKGLGADYLPYEFSQPFYVNDFHMSVRHLVRDYLEAKNFA